MSKLYIAYGNDVKAMASQILKEARPETGLGKNAAIGLKPNLVVAKGWQSGATTNPAVCEAVIEYFFEKGYKNIAIIESSWLAVDTAQAYRVCGYDDLARRYGIELIDVKKDRFQTCEYGGMKIDVSARALALDCLINLPLIKGHCQTGITCALKNMKGLISENDKRQFHAMGLDKPVAYLNKMIRPALTIADGTCTDPGFEEGGNPINMNMMIAGSDSVLLDAYAAGLLGHKPQDIGYIDIAEKIGVGSTDISAAETVYLNGALGISQRTGSQSLDAAKARIDADKACSACYGNLISALIHLAETGTQSGFRVSVGQGFKGRRGDIGCGDCTAGFDHSIEGCPPSADEIFAQLMGIRRGQ